MNPETTDSLNKNLKLKQLENAAKHTFGILSDAN